jgi:hypothetical protein
MIHRGRRKRPRTSVSGDTKSARRIAEETRDAAEASRKEAELARTRAERRRVDEASERAASNERRDAAEADRIRAESTAKPSRPCAPPPNAHGGRKRRAGNVPSSTERLLRCFGGLRKSRGGPLKSCERPQKSLARQLRSSGWSSLRCGPPWQNSIARGLRSVRKDPSNRNSLRSMLRSNSFEPHTLCAALTCPISRPDGETTIRRNENRHRRLVAALS